MGRAEKRRDTKVSCLFDWGRARSFFEKGKTRRAETLYDLPNMRAKKGPAGKVEAKREERDRVSH